MESPLPETIVAIVCAVIGFLFKQYREHLAWKQLQAKAIETCKSDDPRTTNDPHEAVTEALITANQAKIAQASGQIRLVLNGDHRPNGVDKSNGGDK